MASVGIVNVTGYGGVELARLLSSHPRVELVSVTGRGAVGQRLSQVFPHLADISLEVTAELGKVDLAFSALPHRASVEALLPLVSQGVKVVDISADLRLKEPGDYEVWYDYSHPSPELLDKAVYGIPELRRKEVVSSNLVANPGCYPTSAILALAPAVRERMIGSDIIIDAKSGVSGAGRTLSLGTHYSEVNENFSAYGLEGHRHLPDIEQELGAQETGGAEYNITFVPHLVPMTRGIFSTCYVMPREGGLALGEMGREELKKLYREFYKGEPFVKIVDTPPQTKHTWGNNLCLIYPTMDLRTGRIVIVSCLDNLVKGAAGQAIQNMNLMLGFPETTGLEALALYP